MSLLRHAFHNTSHMLWWSPIGTVTSCCLYFCICLGPTSSPLSWKKLRGASDGFVDLRCDVCLRRFAGAYVRLALSSLPTASVHSRVNGMLCMDNSLRPGGTRIRREVCSPFSKLISRVCAWCVGIRRCQSKLAEQLRAADFLCGFFGVVVRFWA